MASGYGFSEFTLNHWISYEADFVISESAHRIGLFKNDLVVPPIPTIGDIVEADFPGYERFDIGTPTYSVARDGDVYVATFNVVATFQASGGTGQLIYGYFMFSEPDGELMWVEAFPSPINAVVGLPIPIMPRIKLKTC